MNKKNSLYGKSQDFTTLLYAYDEKKIYLQPIAFFHYYTNNKQNDTAGYYFSFDSNYPGDGFGFGDYYQDLI